jgi:transcriptional regulator with XRE-family HTH domain
MNLSFGERLTHARKRADLTQEQLGEAVEASRNTVGSWERDETLPDGKSMIQIPRVLGVSGHWLLTGEGDMRLDDSLDSVRVRIIGTIASDEHDEPTLRLVQKTLRGGTGAAPGA